MKPIDKIKELILKMNDAGIPVPLLRDPDKDGPSITFTFFYLSGMLALASLIGKFTKVFGEIDVSGSVYLFISAAGIYTARKMTSDGKTVTIEQEKNKEE